MDTVLYSKTMTSFSFKAAGNSVLSAEINGTISGTNISATVPFGTDVTALVATFTTIGQIVKVGNTTQASGTSANNFSSVVTYTVAAANGSTQDYTVTVTVGVVGDSVNYTVGSVSLTMIYVPGGITYMAGINDDGDKNNDGDTIDSEDEPGGTTVTNAYLIGQTEVTYELWYEVYTWATSNGYTFVNPGREGNDGTIGAAPTTANQEPATQFNWREAMIWMNALTEYYNAQNGTSLTPVYYSDANYSTPFKTATDSATTTEGTPGTQDNPYIKSGSVGNTDMANNTATGFRFLTSDEWELSARYKNDANSDGDIQDANEYYPGDYASGATADYSDATATGLVGIYSTAATAVVKSKNANALGLYDMTGNVMDRTFDLNGTDRVIRGGCFNLTATDMRLGRVWDYYAPDLETGNFGVRIARTP
jgi:formylglycine-generating enzyme